LTLRVVHVLHVCTGNICRSPMAERIMRHELAVAFGTSADQFEVHSAGTYGGHVGEPMNDTARRILEELGLDGSGHVVTWLREPQILWADVILTGTAQHRAEVLTLEPSALRHTFALRELARLATHVRPEELGSTEPADRLLELVTIAAGLRGLHPVARRDTDDLGDPYGGPPEEYREVAATIVAAVRDILRPLGTRS
jgi:protein-tyrosine phosphatase